MAVIGHWANMTEVEKLTQSQLIPGVIEEDIKRENLLYRLPVAQASGKSIKWNRELTTTEAAVAKVDVGDQLTWTGDITYTQMEVELKRCYMQRVLDDFNVEVYGTINDYEAQALLECKKGMVRSLGDRIIYDDLTYGTKEFDGLHALAAVQTGTDLDIDEGGALSLNNLRLMIDSMKYGCDFLAMPPVVARRLDAVAQEAGIASWVGPWQITQGINQIGLPVTYFGGIPIVKTDFLVAEQDTTGAGSNKRAKWTSSTKTYSIFGIKLGNVFNREPGLTFAFGNTRNAGDFYKLVRFPALEDYDAQGIRLVNYSALLLGSKLALGRIYDVTDAAVTA
jgi:hypothetical protein